MTTELVHVGFGNMVAMNRVVAIVPPTSAPIKRLVQDGKNSNLIIDMTSGRRTRSVLVTDSGHLILAAVSAETVAGRLLTGRVIPRSVLEAEV
ncbi:MAG: DUF370 domain-containing protein [Dehalococcoidia bacterium]|jgi:hypothetical protein|nr:DUF370 domain-containing protein [Dehalococcoidia bacterium]MDP6510510.1 DUF370 domain-containing protein [Dehalococcoidia bacterium]MDP6782134.1 DUF370 domain-containing protein [Dehalococcoidia bacterium]